MIQTIWKCACSSQLSEAGGGDVKVSLECTLRPCVKIYKAKIDEKCSGCPLFLLSSIALISTLPSGEQYVIS